ncbi:MAG TPA: hypothetical protein VNZ04_14330 [Trinickia sp.]|nr:hypothetical protein [Trinickia sp.]
MPRSRCAAMAAMLTLDCSEHDTTLMSMMIETLVGSHVPARC